jgi:hypothetical protein
MSSKIKSKDTKVNTTMNKDTKVEKATKKTKEVKVEEVEEDDDDDEYTEEDDDEDEDEEDEDDEDENDEGDNEDNLNSEEKNELKDIKDKRDKKEKPTFDQLMKDIESNRTKVQANNVIIEKLLKDIKAAEKENQTLDKQNGKMFALLPKAHEESVNKARKEKKKRTNTSRKGILEPLPVPPIFAKFLDVKETDLIDRTKIMSLLSNKFKELGLKQGQKTILDKKTAKIFGLEEGHIIEFKQFHSFISSIYKSEKPNEVQI